MSFWIVFAKEYLNRLLIICVNQENRLKKKALTVKF